MPVIKFNYNPVTVDNLATWPECHARERNARGKQSYSKFLSHFKLHKNTLFSKTITYKSLLEMNIIPALENFYHLKDPVSDIMEHLIMNDARFIDEEFGAGHMRLIDRNENIKLFNNAPMFSNFSQKNLGNCFLVCNIGAVAAHPEAHKYLLSSIYPPVYNPYGVYSIRLYYKGRDVYVIIDDYLPFHLNYSGMCDKNECWYFLIEKAICKLNVYCKVGHYFKSAEENYKCLNGAGANFHKYFYLEKCDIIKFNGNNKEEFWKFIIKNLRYHRTPYVVSFAKHSYLIVDAFEYNGIRLIRWHNPVNYVVNYNGPYGWKRTEDWKLIPRTIQIDSMENDRFLNGDVHTTYWTTYDVYLNRAKRKKCDSHIEGEALDPKIHLMCNSDYYVKEETFVSTMLLARNRYLQLHREMPGLFLMAIESDNVYRAYRKIVRILKNEYNNMKPAVTTEFNSNCKAFNDLVQVNLNKMIESILNQNNPLRTAND